MQKSKEDLRHITLGFAQRMGAKWLPKLEKTERILRETQAALVSENEEDIALSDSYALACAQRQYAELSRLCGELWESLTDWKSAAVPLFPSADSVAAAKELPSSNKDNLFTIKEADGVICIQMPFPIKRYAKRKAAAPALDILRAELLRFLSTTENLSVISPDNIFYFWYIYPMIEECDKLYYPDNDNYLVKPIIDTVCEMLSIQDKGTDTYLFSATALCSDVPEGAYLLLAPQADTVHDFRSQENALAFLRKFRG